MFCQNCGKQIPENVKFCNHCGAAQIPSPARNTQQTKQPVKQNSINPHQNSVNQQPNENAFKSFVGSTAMRNIFIVMLALTIVSLAVLPPSAVGLSVFVVLFGIMWAVQNNNMKKRIAQMQANGTYNAMLCEFANAASMNNDKVRYSENYIFSKHSGSFYKYEEICWVYRHNTSYLFIPMSSNVMIGNNKGKVFAFCTLNPFGKSGNEEIRALAALIQKKNPQVLLGFDAARQAEYKRRTK